jgi:hypothetical protein
MAGERRSKDDRKQNTLAPLQYWFNSSMEVQYNSSTGSALLLIGSAGFLDLSV